MTIRTQLSRLLALGTLLYAFSAIPVFAKPIPDNLGNGLDKLVTNNLIQQGAITAVPSDTLSSATITTKRTKKSISSSNVATTTTTQSFDAYKAMIAKQAASYNSRALTQSATGRYLVQIMPNGRVPVTTLQGTLQAKYPAITAQAVNTTY